MIKKKNGKKVSHRSLSAMPNSYPDIAERFRQFVKETGLTYNDLAAATGTTYETLQAYAHGRSSPNFYTMRQLKKKFGLNYDWLIDGTKSARKVKPLSQKVEQLKTLLKEWEGS